jgi:hypothetical protein
MKIAYISAVKTDVVGGKRAMSENEEDQTPAPQSCPRMDPSVNTGMNCG